MSASLQSPPLRRLVSRDFSGGPNVRDAQPQLADNECVDAWNVTFDRRGGVGARLGQAKYNSAVFGGGAVKNVHYSTTVGDLITQAGASLYKGTSATANKTFTTSARVGFADFAGSLCVIHPIDGLFTSADGVTFTAVADLDAPKGDTLAVWQNKLFAAGNPTNKSRVTWSDAGTATSWTPASFVDLREKDDEQIVCLAGASGLDINGRPGLLAFKRRSAYRIYDSATGAYWTVDGHIGAASALSVVTVSNSTYSLSERGVWVTDGVGRMKPLAERLLPLWDPSQINYAQLPLLAAGKRGDRCHFSLPRAGSTVNDLAFEYDPETGSFAPGSNAASCYASYLASTEILYGGSPTVSGQVYRLYTGGTDDGAAIASRFQTRWFEPGDGFLAQMWRLRVGGNGSFALNVRRDWEDGGGNDNPVVLSDGSTLAWDSGLNWDSGLEWETPVTQDVADLFTLGVARAVSFKASASTTTTVNAPQILGQVSGPELGAWQLYSLDLSYVPLAAQ